MEHGVNLVLVDRALHHLDVFDAATNDVDALSDPVLY